MPTPLPRSSPEAQGVSSQDILTFLQEASAADLELHSFMLLRHGQVVAEGWWEPYSSERLHLLYSLSKSFASTAIGFAEAEGLLSLDDKVISFFPDKLPDVISDNLAAMTVHHLLEMGTGHRTDTTEKLFSEHLDDPVRGFLSLPPDAAPGSVFCYNSGATFMLSAILQKLTGQTLVAYLEPRVFAPLGIEQKYWQATPDGMTLGFSGLHLTTEAVARFGQLYLQKGEWQGEPLLPEGWVERATRGHISNAGTSDNPDWQQGYGYQFWRCQHGHYRGDGAFGQFCVVMKERDAVLVVTSAVEAMQKVLDLAWAHLLPAFHASALPENSEAARSLTEYLRVAKLQPVQGETSSPVAERVSGQRYSLKAYSPEVGRSALPPFTEARFLFAEQQWTLELTSELGRHAVTGGYGDDLIGRGSLGQGPAALAARQTWKLEDSLLAASGAWRSEDTFVALARSLETPHSLRLECHFLDDEVRIARRWNVSFGPLELPPLVGRLA